MNRQQQMEERLWDYIDGLAGAEERSLIGALIAGNREWQLRYAELVEMQKAIKAEELETPSLRFSKNVMEEIAHQAISPATHSYINKNIIRGIGAFFGVMLGGMLIYAFTLLKGSVNHSAPAILFNESSVKDSLYSFNWGIVFNSTYINVFIMINLVLALMFLNMLLERKKRKTGSVNP